MIAKNHKVTLAALQKANPTADSKHLKIGQKITIPEATGASTTATPPSHHTTTSTVTTTAPAVSTYTVKAGDTLRKIAKEIYGSEAQWKKIYRANRTLIGDDPDTIKFGMKLRIPK